MVDLLQFHDIIIYKKNTLINKNGCEFIKNNDNFDKEKAYDYIASIFDSASFDEIHSGITSLLKFIEYNPKHKRWICRELTDSMVRYCSPYLFASLFSDKSDKNIVIVPPKHSLIMFMSTCVPYSKSTVLVMEGLRKFAERCCEFGEPLEASITEDEIRSVLDVAQKKLQILNIIAPKKPLKILMFANSHSEFDNECGITDGIDREAIISVYHPREITLHDRVFIFTHELGHALHMALTNDIKIMPYGFDEFSGFFAEPPKTIEEKQEAFANAAAIAILNGSELDKHLPKGFNKNSADWFNKYIKFVIEQHLSL